MTQSHPIAHCFPKNWFVISLVFKIKLELLLMIVVWNFEWRKCWLNCWVLEGFFFEMVNEGKVSKLNCQKLKNRQSLIRTTKYVPPQLPIMNTYYKPTHQQMINFKPCLQVFCIQMSTKASRTFFQMKNICSCWSTASCDVSLIEMSKCWFITCYIFQWIGTTNEQLITTLFMNSIFEGLSVCRQ